MTIDRATVRTWGKLPEVDGEDTDLDALLQRVIDGCLAHARRQYPAPDPAATGYEAGDTAEWELGLLLQISRLWRRRSTPEGVLQFGQDGAVRVSRFDPDVDEILSDFRVWNVG